MLLLLVNKYDILKILYNFENIVSPNTLNL
jgi:hypothetical protein